MTAIVVLLVATAYLFFVYLLLMLASRADKVTPAPSRNAR